MTAGEYIDEVMMRLRRHDVVLNLSRPQILTNVNKARRTVQHKTMGVVPHRYAELYTVDISPLIHERNKIDDANNLAKKDAITIALPSHYISEMNVILMYEIEGITYRRLCRQMTSSESHNVMQHAWNQPTYISPTYIIEHEGSNLLRLSGINFDDIYLWDNASNIQLEIWYISAIDFIEDINSAGGDDTEIPIPPEAEELVVYLAMLNCLQSIAYPVAYASTAEEVKDAVSNLLLYYESITHYKLHTASKETL